MKEKIQKIIELIKKEDIKMVESNFNSFTEKVQK